MADGGQDEAEPAAVIPEDVDQKTGMRLSKMPTRLAHFNPFKLRSRYDLGPGRIIKIFGGLGAGLATVASLNPAKAEAQKSQLAFQDTLSKAGKLAKK